MNIVTIFSAECMHVLFFESLFKVNKTAASKATLNFLLISVIYKIKYKIIELSYSKAPL